MIHIEQKNIFPNIRTQNFEDVFSIPLACTRRTMVFASKYYPDWIMKTTRANYNLNRLRYDPFVIAQQGIAAQEYISNELVSDAITRKFAKQTPGLVIPEEYYYLETDFHGQPKPYRLQKRQFGRIFSNIPNLPEILNEKHKKILIHLTDATLSCYEERQFHLDLIGFACGHEPTFEEIRSAYQTPFINSTNLILRDDGVIAWVDAKISKLSPDLNKLRTELFFEQRNRLLESKF